MDVIKEIGYGREVQADVEGFVSLRLRSLRVGSAGRFFEGGHPADIGDLLQRNVVLAIEDVANDEDKAFLMGTLIIRIVEHLRMRRQEGAERRAPARHRDRGGAPAAPRPRRRTGQHPRRRAVRGHAGGDPRVRRGHRGGRADPDQARLRRREEHRAEGRAPAPGRGRPAAGRGRDEPERGAVPAGRLAAAGRRGGLRRRDGPAAAHPGAAGRGPRATDPRPHAADLRTPFGGVRAASAGPAGRARWSSSARPTCSPSRPSGPGCGSGPTPWCWRYCTNRPVPGVPRVLADLWAELPLRRRECLLATRPNGAWAAGRGRCGP